MHFCSSQRSDLPAQWWSLCALPHGIVLTPCKDGRGILLPEMQEWKLFLTMVTMEWSSENNRSQQFFFLSPSSERCERKNDLGGERLCGAGGGRARPFVTCGSVLTARAKDKLVQKDQFTLGIPSASPIRKSISWCVSTSSAAWPTWNIYKAIANKL